LLLADFFFRGVSDVFVLEDFDVLPLRALRLSSDSFVAALTAPPLTSLMIFLTSGWFRLDHS
jgi:hypothetical protein